MPLPVPRVGLDNVHLGLHELCRGAKVNIVHTQYWEWDTEPGFSFTALHIRAVTLLDFCCTLTHSQSTILPGFVPCFPL
jgi:hypothetical protein